MNTFDLATYSFLYCFSVPDSDAAIKPSSKDKEKTVSKICFGHSVSYTTAYNPYTLKHVFNVS